MASGRKRIGIIGAGLGGLAAGLRLANRGHRVVIFEKTDQVGGRNRHEWVGDCQFDGGPTLLMMREPFKKLFADVGERMDDHIESELCDPSYRVFYRDGSKLDATTNMALMLERLEALVGPEDAAAYPEFLGQLGALYHDSIPHFVRTNYTRPLKEIVHPAQLGRVLKHGMLGNLAKRVGKTFKDPRTRMLFSFQTMYLGLSPYDAPWVYATLTYMEYGEGIWYPKGGLPVITDTVARLAQERGAEIRLNTSVKKIDGKSVLLADGSSETFDLIIANADMPYVQRELEQDPARRDLRYSCSAYCLYLDYAGQIPELLHHNVFFGRDFKGNLDALFHTGQTPEDPAFYACISARSEPSRAPRGHENLFLLIPCPNLETEWTPERETSLKNQVYKRLGESTSFDPSRIRQTKQRSPIDWRDELNLVHGATFGISADLFQSAFFRPKNRSQNNPNLYYVGASTVPGNGLPMVLISAELAERRLLEDGQIPDTFWMPAFDDTPVERPS